MCNRTATAKAAASPDLRTTRRGARPVARTALRRPRPSPGQALAPAEIYASLLDQGTCHCAIRTMYRILEQHAETRERRRQLRHPVYQKAKATALMLADLGVTKSHSLPYTSPALHLQRQPVLGKPLQDPQISASIPQALRLHRGCQGILSMLFSTGTIRITIMPASA